MVSMRFLGWVILLISVSIFVVWLVQRFFILPPGALFITIITILLAALAALSFKKGG
ncbi:MAG: hypothetical protein Q8R12_04100 [bacterium]|nr:hypothetical protein [bacterium]